MERAAALAGLSRWVVRPSLTGGFSGAGAAVLYIAVQMEFPSWRDVAAFAAIAGVVLGVLALVGERIVHQGLVHLADLGNGRRPVTREHLAKAIGECARIADRAFFTTVVIWLLGSGLTASALLLVRRDLSFLMGLRIFALGIALGPVTSILVQVLVTRRARAATGKVAAAGLSPAEVIEAVPRPRTRMRWRFVIFTAVTVIAPCFLVADVSLGKADAAFQEIALKGSGPSPEALLSEVAKQQVLATGGLALMILALVIASAFVAGSALGEPMRQIGEDAGRVAQGDLRRVRVVPAEDELWLVSKAFTRTQAHLTTVLRELQRAGAKVNGTTAALVELSSKHEAGANEQAAGLNEIMATTEELARSAKRIAQESGQVAVLAQKTLEFSQAGTRSSETFIGAMARLKADNQRIAQAIIRLNNRVQQIGKIVEFINGIADRSDLLALNAELEGTKAGEVGRGFSMVAAQMRKLAEDVVSSTGKITGRIEEIRNATHSAVMATEAGVQATERGANVAQEVSDCLREIVRLAAETSDAARAISMATQQQESGTDQLAQVMASLLGVTERSAEATRSVSKANGKLFVLAKDLKQMVDRFQLG